MSKTADKSDKFKKKLTRHAKTALKHAKDHFVPHGGNKHHPYVLRHHVIFGYALIAVLIKAVIITGSIAYPETNLEATSINPTSILELTNQARASANLPILKMNTLLNSAAQAKARDMLENQYFAHTSPAGLTPWYWIKRSGYQYIKSAENLAVHYSQAEDVQAAWMTSLGHRSHILNPEYTESGVGIAEGTFEKSPSIFVVQYFGRPIENIKVENNVKAAGTAATTSPSSITAPVPAPVQKPILAPAPLAKPSKTIPTQEARLPKPAVTATLGMVKNQEIPQENEINFLIYGPQAMPQNIFALQNPSAVPSNTTPNILAKIANAFYLLLIIFLAGSLAITALVKFHYQKITVAVHALSVIGLIIFLGFWH